MNQDTSDKYRGLTPAEVEENRRVYGVNVLTPAKRESVWAMFLQKFRDPLIVILLVAGVLSVAISFYEYYGLHQGYEVFIEPVGIFAAIILATGLGFIFEYKAEKEFSILNKVNDEQPVRVIRAEGAAMIPRSQVVVGDIVVLEAGQEIPADARLLESVRLSVDESTLTGEPLCHKSADPAALDREATFAANAVMRGTKVMEGHGIARVTAVGDATENGRVFTAAQIDNSVKTPLNEQLDRLGTFVSVASYIIGALVIVGRITMYLIQLHGEPVEWVNFMAYILQSVMLAVTLIVVAVPEGLPMAVTLSLAYSMRRMLRTHNLVRKMHACETMGAVTVICTDKTGTLTANRMEVQEATFFNGSADQTEAMVAMALNSTAELDLADPSRPSAVGNPTEGALLLWVRTNGGDYEGLRRQWIRSSELPFSTERKYMATVVRHRSTGRRLLLVKGAPEIVYAMCSHADEAISAPELDAKLKQYQQQAMRTLGFASQELTDADPEPIGADSIEAPHLHFDGFVAISDPVREDVPDAIEECVSAGIKVKIVTGDTPATAKEVARRVGLWTADDTDDCITTGADVAAMTDDELDRCVGRWKIIARARPMDKKRLVEALQRRGEVVAVTGDGTNDAPALKAAHVGLSMGDGTSVAKEASDITIVNNSFSGITNAVVWGRSLYRNIQRFILFQLTVNVAACLTVLIGSFMGTQAPLTVTQMLWVNLVMDTFAAMALASLPPSRSVLNAPPRNRRKFIITPDMTRFIVGVGGLFAALMIYMVYVLEHANVTHLSNLINFTICGPKNFMPYEVSVFFTIFVMLQVWNLFNAKAFGTHRSAFHLRRCSEFVFIFAVIFIGQILIVQCGGQFFSVKPLSLHDWLIIIAATSPVLWIGELLRLIPRRK